MLDNRRSIGFLVIAALAVRREAMLGGGTRKELLAARRALAECIEAHGLQRSAP